MRVLVVEDEPLIRLLASDILEASGHVVSDAGSAAAALALAARHRFDVAVVDLGLPDASCPVLLRALLHRQPWLGIVISTGRQPDDPLVVAARRSARNRISAVLGKPWTETALVEAAQRAGCLSWRAGLAIGPLIEAGCLTAS